MVLWVAVVRSHCAAAAWVVRPPQRPPKVVRSQTDIPRRPVGPDPLPCTRQALDPPGRSSDPRLRGQRWAYRPGILGVVSCLSLNLPQTLSRTLTRLAAAQVEIPCSPLVEISLNEWIYFLALF